MSINKGGIALLSIVLVVLQGVACAQVRQVKAKAGAISVSKSEVLRLTGTKGRPAELPLSFARELNADTVLAPNTVFKEVIDLNSWSDAKADFSKDIDGTVLIRRLFRKDSLILKKNEDLLLQAGEYYEEPAWYYFRLKNDVMTLENKDTQKKEGYRIYLNKMKSRILRIQHLETKQLYMPAAFEGVSPTIGL